jgi:hypothetical protein
MGYAMEYGFTGMAQTATANGAGTSTEYGLKPGGLMIATGNYYPWFNTIVKASLAGENHFVKLSF